jgi:dolichol-phosphate mannosyltransferase
MIKKVSIIIPFLNEADNIPILINTLSEYFSRENNFKAELIFVNDGSTDKSNDLLLKLKHENYTCILVSLSKNFGSHAALRAGIKIATGDYITFLYADLQDPINLISELYDAVYNSKKDIVWATRNSTKNSFLESTFSRTYSALMKKYVSESYPENGFDIVIFSKKIGGILNSNIESNSSIFLQILTSGFNQGIIFYDKQTRKIGKSKWTLGKKIKLFIDSFVAFSYAPIRLVSILGIVLFLVGIFWSLYLVIRKLVFNDLEIGWPALMAILSIGFGITNISLGIIAEYLWRTLDSTRKRPVYIIDEIIEIKKNE